MVKRVIKSIKIIILFLLIVNIVLSNNICFAQQSIDVTKDPDYWTTIEEDDESSTFDQKIRDIVETIRIIGMIVSIVSIMVIGIKFMLGSVEDKSQYKQNLYPWFVGALILFGLSAILTLIYDISNNLFA